MPQGDDKEKDVKAQDASASVDGGGATATKPGATAGAQKATASQRAKAVGGKGTGRISRAIARYVRMAPRKLRLVADAIRGKSVTEARSILQFCGKRAAGPLSKVLESAVANAANNHQMETANLVIATAYIDQGPSFKGWIPRARGRASAVHKFTSHITIEVTEREVG